MKYIFTILIFIMYSSTFTFSQSVFFKINNINVVMKDGVIITIGANNTDALSVINNGTLQSEEQINIISWYIGTNTGIYSVPFTNSNGDIVKIEYNIITFGVGLGNILFSTSPTRIAPTDDSKLLSTANYPSPVTNMNNTAGIDNSNSVINRFWYVDYSSTYTSKPNGILKFYYSDTDLSTITENNLQAQYWNNTDNIWILPPIGNVDMANNNVNNINSNNVSSVWTLTDNLSPLPIELIYFKAECNFDKNMIEFIWETATEINSDLFVLESSYNAYNWIPITNIKAAGNSTVNKKYKYEINSINLNAYYRLKEIDIDGLFIISNIITINCENKFSNNISIYPNPTNDKLFIDIKTDLVEDLNIEIYNCIGEKIFKDIIKNNKQFQKYIIDMKEYDVNIYVLKIYNKQGYLINKIINLK